LHTIRSFEKLTAAGMTFLDTDIIPILEETLPGRFGGGPADYQLVESETEDGTATVVLLVHPALGPLDERAILDVFLTEAASKSYRFSVMAGVWRTMGLPKVERRRPMMTAAGKILHVHVDSDGRTAARE
jgi:hypothetical protein